MFSSPMISELAASRHADLIANADAQRLARRARRDQGQSTTTGRVGRTWLRTTTQPAQV